MAAETADTSFLVNSFDTLDADTSAYPSGTKQSIVEV